MPEALSINDSHLGMRRSFNSAAPVPMQSMANIPMYRSFDQGASLASFPRSLASRLVLDILFLISCFVSQSVAVILCPVFQHRRGGGQSYTKFAFFLAFAATK